MMLFFILIFAGMINPVFAQSSDPSLKATAVVIPGGGGGIGFDDLVYSSQLHKVLVPAGHTGKLYLIDPSTFEMTSIGGFSSSNVFKKGHEVGISSVDEWQGYAFIPDHGAHQLDVVNLASRTIIGKAPLAGDPDFVRFIESAGEVWVTEPDNEKNKQIEVFIVKFNSIINSAIITHELDIPITSGPESLTIDQTKGIAYTNFGTLTGVIDVNTHKIVAQWPNSCEKAHGTTFDKQRGILFVGCAEGKAVALDANNKGKQLATLTTGAGADLIDYNSALSHLYITGSKNATLSILGVSAGGQLSLLSVSPAAPRAHCVVGDDQNNIWVCDPHHGQLLRYKDTFPIIK